MKGKATNDEPGTSASSSLRSVSSLIVLPYLDLLDTLPSQCFSHLMQYSPSSPSEYLLQRAKRDSDEHLGLTLPVSSVLTSLQFPLHIDNANLLILTAD